MRYLSVCSGMEAASVAWHPLGWTPVGFSEIEPFPCAILKHRFPNTPNYGSLTEHHTWPIEPGAIDLLVGGTPCQSFSVAGLRKGLADPRGNLALTFLGLADRLKPKWIVWENVPGVLSSAGGRDFGSFLGALVELGYGFAYRVLDAQHFGVPQRRRRVFVVACLGDWRAPAEVLSLREGLRGYLETGGKKRKGVAADAGSGVEASGLPIWRAGDQANAEHMIDHAGTVSCNKGSHGGFIAKPISHWDGSNIHPTLNQSAKGSGGVGASNQELFSQGGAYLVPGASIPYRKSKRAQSVTDNETWVPADVTNTLNNFDLGDTHTTHAVEPMLYENRPTDSRVTGPHDVSPTMTSRFGTGGGNIPLVQHHTPGLVAPTVTSSGPPYSRTGNERVEAEALAITFQPGNHAVGQPIAFSAKDHGGDATVGISPTLRSQNSVEGNQNSSWSIAITFQPGNLRREAGAEPSTTTTTTLKASAGDQTPHVCHPINTMTLGGRPDPVNDRRMTMGVGADGDPQFTLQAAHSHAVATPMAVRRLTPVECERLQGFPDNWSRIPWKGKPETECPDGPRYKACGNSMAVPVMRWIGERIAAVEASSHA